MHLAEDQIKDANIRYHDLAADDYDFKWGIDFDRIGEHQVLTKVRKALGSEPGHFHRALEIGAGTGYFSLNLARAGVLDEVTATDISPGMLDTLKKNAGEIDVEIDTVLCEAESLPFEDASFDLVFGHAVLHHLPDLRHAFDEFWRVLEPGGTLIFCGEPTASGDRLATVPKTAGQVLGLAWRTALGATKRSDEDDPDQKDEKESCIVDELERQVDVHAFKPSDLSAVAGSVGFDEIRVSGEELLANAFGWFARTLEAGAKPDSVPDRWRRLAFRTYVTLQRVDGAALEPLLPARLFYNLLLSAKKPSR